MIENKMWVFRLSIEKSGKPADEPPKYLNRQKIKQEIEDYKKVSLIDHNYPKLDLELLITELFDKNKLRQGWGMELDGMNLDLRKDNPDNSDLPTQEWITNFSKIYTRIWDEDYDLQTAMGRWNILKLMKDMKIGNIIFIPRIPKYGTFTVATVKKEYGFEKFNGKHPKGHVIGYGHVIEVEKIEKFDYENHFPAKIFNPYQKAVCGINEDNQNFIKLNKFINKYYIK